MKKFKSFKDPKDDQLVVGATEKVQRRKRGLVIAIIALLVVGICVFALRQNSSNQLTPEQAKAIRAADTASAGLQGSDATVSRLNVAVTYADDKKCDLARVIYDTALKKDADYDKESAGKYKARIDQACSGKQLPATEE